MRTKRKVEVRHPTHLSHPWAVEVLEDQINRPGPMSVALQLFPDRVSAELYAKSCNVGLFHATVRPTKPGDEEYA